ncbi:MAG: thiamine diphosphokinase [Anaerolineae bacterium CFX3]|jgi:thiamine pyrophosphokinase|nr:thiamine diphosphokinase [Anaerolineae bacterium CFX3]MCQ3945416.1 thiamine diphosphokinase [Anaerolineae bacterium]OQY81302.1 MAG: thiamine diphosphokinase [Anaerolineae bacterium UTCFX3]RIK27777.1 MAG: thiamine diphosphokinase [Anaerolineae bacterium]
MVFLMSRCLILANGILPSLDAARRILRPDDFILCADGGTRHALDLGLVPSIVIGDLDSISEEERSRLDGVQLMQFPRDKDETDLELALNYAIERGFDEIVIVAALGGRLDQTLANLALVSAARRPSLVTRIDDGLESARFCRDAVQVEGRSGDLVSLIPWGGEVRGVRTEGLRWPLSNETLLPHETRGVSNEMTGAAARVEVESGLLLVVHRRRNLES